MSRRSLRSLRRAPSWSHQRDVESLVGEVFGEGAAGLAGTENEDLHGSIRLDSLSGGKGLQLGRIFWNSAANALNASCTREAC